MEKCYVCGKEGNAGIAYNEVTKEVRSMCREHFDLALANMLWDVDTVHPSFDDWNIYRIVNPYTEDGQGIGSQNHPAEYILLYFRGDDITFTEIAKNDDGSACIFSYPEEAKQYALDYLDFGYVQIQIVPLVGREI